MITLTEAQAGLRQLKARYEQDRGALVLLETQKRERQETLDRVRMDIDLYRQMMALFTKVSEYAREQVRRRMEETVTAALQAVFGEGFEFRVILREIAGQPAAEFEVVSCYGDGLTVATSPEDARGGGVVDVVSLALRLAVLELYRPKLDGPVVLDEPGKHVSREYLPNLAYFLKRYSEQTGRQVIMVTHADLLSEIADKTFRVTLVDGTSEVKET